MDTRRRVPSPAMLVAAVALVLALGGTAVAAPELSLNDVKKVAKKQAKKQAGKLINKRAPGLTVAHANTAGTANSANAVSTLVPFGPTTVGEGAADVTLASRGPLSLVGSCDANGASTEANVLAATTEENSAAAGDDAEISDLDPGTAPANRTFETPGATSATTQDHSDGYDDQFSMFAPSGTALHGTVSSLANGTAGTCTFYGSVTIVK